MMRPITRLAPRKRVAASKTSVTHSLTWPTGEVCEGTVGWKAATRFALAVSCAALFFFRGRCHPLCLVLGLAVGQALVQAP